MQNIWQNAATVSAVAVSGLGSRAFISRPRKTIRKQPVERDIAKEAALRRLRPPLTNN
jgi:hypothetical protein